MTSCSLWKIAVFSHILIRFIFTVWRLWQSIFTTRKPEDASSFAHWWTALPMWNSWMRKSVFECIGSSKTSESNPFLCGELTFLSVLISFFCLALKELLKKLAYFIGFVLSVHDFFLRHWRNQIFILKHSFGNWNINLTKTVTIENSSWIPKPFRMITNECNKNLITAVT